MGLLLKQQKSVTSKTFFISLYLRLMTRVVVHPQQVTADLAYFLFLWYFQIDSFQQKNFYCKSVLSKSREDLWELVRTGEDLRGLVRT